MENYSYNSSYPESGDSSPRSREIEFDNSASWEDSSNPPPNYKVKFMCSYGGKIQPRPHDNQLSYVGGETKILSVDRSVKFTALLSKLIGLCESDNISFKYQLPGEDLDALISVTNDDDLEHMMHEYDRLYRVSPKPARLRIFVFPGSGLNSASTRSFGSEEGIGIKTDKEKFVEALNSGPVITTAAVPVPQPSPPPPQHVNNVDFLFGIQNQAVAPPPPAVAAMGAKVHDVVDDPGLDDRDPIQKHIQDLQRLRLEEQHGMYRRKSDDNLNAAYSAGGDQYYKVAPPEKVAPVNVSAAGIPGYHQVGAAGGGVFPGGTLNTEQPVYMIPAHAGGGVYHAPPQMGRQVNVTGQAGQGYYAVYREQAPQHHHQQQHNQQQQQQMYNIMTSMPPQSVVAASMAAVPPQQGYGMVRPVATTAGGGVMVTDAGYAAAAAYGDGGMGRQVIYTTPTGGAMNAPQMQGQYQAMAPGGALNQEAVGGKVVKATTQASV